MIVVYPNLNAPSLSPTPCSAKLYSEIPAVTLLPSIPKLVSTSDIWEGVKPGPLSLILRHYK